MNRKHGFLFGFAVLLLTAMFSLSLAGCENPSGGDGGPTIETYTGTTGGQDWGKGAVPV
jgi:hypothetical protein